MFLINVFDGIYVLRPWIYIWTLILDWARVSRRPTASLPFHATDVQGKGEGLYSLALVLPE